MKDTPIIFGAWKSRYIQSLSPGDEFQTRHVMKPQPMPFAGGVHPNHVALHPAPYIDAYCGERKTEANPRGMGTLWCWWTEDDRMGPEIARCPYGAPGHRLWSREAHMLIPRLTNEPDPRPLPDLVKYRSTDEDECEGNYFHPWRSPLFMPRWASRGTFDLVDVRVQRIQEISEEDARAEGCPEFVARWWAGFDREYRRSAVQEFRMKWDAINGQRRVSVPTKIGEPRYPRPRTEVSTSYSWDANPFVFALTLRVVKAAEVAA